MLHGIKLSFFFTVNSFVAKAVSGGAVPLYMIPVMILLPVLIGIVTGIPVGAYLKRKPGKAAGGADRLVPSDSWYQSFGSNC